MGRAAEPSAPLSWSALVAGGCCLAPAAAAAIGVMVSPWSWLGDLATPWSTHAALALLVPLVLWRRRRWLAVMVSIIAVVLLVPGMASAWEERAVAAPAHRHQLSVAAVNVFKGNPLRAGDIPELAALDVEVLGLIEIDRGDEESLRDDPRWPHQHWAHAAADGQRGFGSAILSRHPLTDVTIHDLHSDVLIDATVRRDDAELRVLVVHTMSPGTAARSALRLRHMDAIARLVRTSGPPVVAMGDWNCTPNCRAWTPLVHAGLRRSRSRAPATWPAVFGPFGIPIDHVLVRAADIVETDVRGISGSDHRLVAAVIAW